MRLLEVGMYIMYIPASRTRTSPDN